MKKIVHRIKLATICCIVGLSVNGCNYLDVDPELGLDDDEVFETYSNFRKYFDYIYFSNGGKNMERIHFAFPLYYDLFQLEAFSWYTATDAADSGRLGVSQQNFKSGVLNQSLIRQLTFDVGRADNKPLAKGMFATIRRCNIVIQNIHRCKNATEVELNDLLGQAHLLRGYAHFVLCRHFGGMPYLDHTLEADDEWDLPRLHPHETFTRAAEDLYKGYELLEKAGYMRRNTADNLAIDELVLLQPNGVAALGVRARSLLYAASPLFNVNGKNDWIDAAEAAAEALMAALEHGYEMLPLNKYAQNFYGQSATNENIWAYMISHKNNHANLRSMLAYPQSWNANAAGVCPTQNFVDKFETIKGDPLTTAAERTAATVAGNYDEQNPYVRRDPRLDICIVHDGSTNQHVTGVVNIHYDPATNKWPGTTISGQKNVLFGIDWGSKDNAAGSYTNTGYYCNKYWNGKRGDKDTSHPHLDPLVRLADLYLMYAEAVNEAYGPNGKAGDCPLTAVEAINLVRARVGMPAVQSRFTSDTDTFRKRIQNERNVELAFEGHHYYYDTRRWMTAPESMTETLYGMYVEKITASEDYPIGRKFTRMALPNNRQSTWKNYMYYFPFPDTEMNKLNNFVNNAWM